MGGGFADFRDLGSIWMVVFYDFHDFGKWLGFSMDPMKLQKSYENHLQ